MGNSLLVAFGMMLVLEGIVPFFLPKQWREVFIHITQFSDGQIRFSGLIALLCGLSIFGAIRLFS